MMHKFAADDFRGIGGESVHEKPPYGVKNVSSDITSDIDLRHGLEFILGHFTSSWFPRTISTKTTEGRQVLVDNKEEALARFKQSNYLDCRINAYSGGDVKEDPSFIFIDIDDTTEKNVQKILDKNSRFSAIGGHPTVLFTGSGFHIYQPISSICLNDLQDFSSYQEPSKQFLKFAEKYLSYGKSDPDHNPSFKSCMVRVPGSINSKNGEHVKIVQEWDGHRPSIALMIGSFQLWLATKQKKEAAKFAKSKISNSKFTNTGNFTPRKIEWIEILLKTPLDDYRKTIVNLVLAPYLINIRELQLEMSSGVIKQWLQLCASLRKLNFVVDSLAGNALATASKTGYKPMRLDTLKQRNTAVYRELKLI